MVAKLNDSSLNTPNYLVLIFLELAMLKHMLNHVISKLVFSKLVNLNKDLTYYWSGEPVFCIL